MKVQKTSPQPAFQPIELKITIESAEEYRAIKEMASCYIGCSQAMVDGGQLDPDYQDQVGMFFFYLKNAL